VAPLRLYHNPRCSKSRGALEILKAKGVAVDVIEYLSEPLARSDLEAMLDALPDPPSALVRKDERFEALGLEAGDYETREAVIDVLLEHPELMQRPVAIAGGQGVIGRPSEKVLELL